MSDATQKIVEEDLKETTSSDIYEIDTEDFNKLQAAAKIFLNQVQIVSDLNKRALSQSTVKSKITYIYKSMREDSNYTRQMLEYQHTFETSLNEFLKRKIYLTYVSAEGNLILQDDAAIGKLYQTATANKGRGNISAKNIIDADIVDIELQSQIRKSMAMRRNVYKEAISRWKKNEDEAHMNYNISKHTIYWWSLYHQKLGGWSNPISNRGPIAEGYAGAVINEDPEVVNSNIEAGLAALWNNHIAKDSIGAVIKGDIVLDSNGNIQFAIKTGERFSTAKVGQYINLAYNILQIKQISATELEQNLPKLIRITKASNNIVQKINESVEKIVDNEILNL